MPKQKKTHLRLDPDDILEGRCRPSARELIAVIHDVNPSGRDLSSRETARRYAQKSRLQSLLIERYRDEILCERTEEDGVVGLRHKSSGADACHAVLASLDDEARSWVQLQLDLGDDDVESERPLTPLSEAEPPEEGGPLSNLPTEKIVARGKDCLEAYDFASARELFTVAFDRGSVEAAELLLSLLVEQLGLDDEALALEEQLSSEALYRPAVRVLLAQAAARAYDRPRAERLVGDERGDPGAEVFAALARGALARGEIDLAASDVAEIQKRGPSHPAFVGLSDAVKKRKAEDRAPLEAEARRLFDEGRFDEAEARAAAITARFPESPVAQTIVRAGQERRRRDEARSLARAGSEAVAAGEGVRAAVLLRRAISMGLTGEDASQAHADLVQAEALEREQDEAAKAALVVQSLSTGHLQHGLVDYLALGDTGRAIVKMACPLAELMYLDLTGLIATGPAARTAAQAVMALVRAVDVLNRDPIGAMDLIRIHWPTLQVLRDAQRVWDMANRLSSLKAQKEASERFSDAMRAFNGTAEGIERSLKLLATVKREDLNDPAEFDRIANATRRMKDRMDRAIEIGKFRKAGEHFRARNAIDEVIHLEDALNRDEVDDAHAIPMDWHALRADVIRDIAKVGDRRMSNTPKEDDLLGQEAPRLLDVPCSVLPGGGAIVLAESHERLIFLQSIDVATGRVLRRTTLRIRKPFAVRRVQQRDGRIVLLASGTTVAEIDPTSWIFTDLFSTGDGDNPEAVGVLAPRGRFVWTAEPKDGWWNGMRVYDVERADYRREYSESVARISIRPLLGLDDPRVIVVRDRGAVTVYEARGTPFGPTQDPLPLLPVGTVVHPSGKGLFALIYEKTDTAPRVRWAELTADATMLKAPPDEDRILAHLDPDAPCEAAVSLDARVVFILGYAKAPAVRTRHSKRLLAFALSGDRLAQSFDVEVPPRLTLAQDDAARVVLALSPHEGGIEVVRLDAIAPSFPVTKERGPATPPLELDDLTLVPRKPCIPPSIRLWSVSGINGPGTIEYLELLKGEERRGFIDDLFSPEPEVRALLLPRYASLLSLPKRKLADALADAIVARYPDDPETRQVKAQRAAYDGDWAAVRDGLASIDPTVLGDAPEQHHDHLLGVALLSMRDVVGARRVLLRGAARSGGHCDLSVPLALVGETPPGSPRNEVVLVLDRALRSADEHLAKGELALARRALSGLVVREAREVQTLARLCRAWLSEPDETEPGGAELDGFARRFALAAFVSANAERVPSRRRELPFAFARWDREKLDALAAEATAWLARDIERPRREA